MSKKSKNTEIKLDDLINDFSGLLTPGFKDSIIEIIMNNIYKCHHEMKKLCGYTPYDPDYYESYANLQLPLKKDAKDGQEHRRKTAPKVMVEKETKDKNGNVKIEKVPKESKLKHPTNFSSAAKNYITAVLIKMIYEATLVKDEIEDNNIENEEEIKKLICSYLSENSENALSPIIYRIADSIDSKILGYTLPALAGSFNNKISNKIVDHIKSQATQTLIVNEYTKFLRIFSVRIAADLWFEAKKVKPAADDNKKKNKKKNESDNDDDEEEEKSKKNTKKKGNKKEDDEQKYEPVSKTTTPKLLLQFLMDKNLTLCPPSEKITHNQLDFLYNFTEKLSAIEEEKKKNNAKKSKETGKGKSTGGKSKKKTKKSDDEDEDNKSASDAEDDLLSSSSSLSSDDDDDKPKSKSNKKGKAETIKPKEAPEPGKKGKHRKTEDELDIED